MGNQLNNLLLSTAKNLEILASHTQDYSTNGYLLLIAQDIYEYLDIVAKTETDH